MEQDRNTYIPALRYDWLTPLYDPVIRWTIRESTFKRHLLEQARIEPGHRVLDVGCGTATLAILIKQAHPGAEVVGLDGDPKILEMASLLLHHLTRENKNRTVKEIFRVLRPGGELSVVDFGKPHSAFMRLISLIMRRLEETSDHIAGLLPEVFRDAGFVAVAESARYSTMFGTLSLYRVQKPR